MIDDVILDSILMDVYDAEAVRLEERAASSVHVFSDAYLWRIRKIAGMARRKYITVFSRRRRLLFVAAVLIMVMLAAAATTIAIVRPQIFYDIKERADSWSYSFRRDDPDKLAEKFGYIEPSAPKGFEKVSEDRDADVGSYDISYEDKDGHFIDYHQEGNIEGLGLSITNTAEKKDITVSGHRGSIYHEDDTYTVLWDDGYYVYMIYGNIPKAAIISMAESIEKNK